MTPIRLLSLLVLIFAVTTIAFSVLYAIEKVKVPINGTKERALPPFENSLDGILLILKDDLMICYLCFIKIYA